MSRIFISGSSAGLGLMAADLLVSQGHQVVLHARSADRAAALDATIFRQASSSVSAQALRRGSSSASVARQRTASMSP